jgi:thiamine-monophosphate kinase
VRENDLIRRIRARVGDPDGVLGIGDDCCLWTPSGRTCLSVDTVVEDRHFRAEDPPGSIGRKAAGAALSDLAAMGARPVGAVVALTCPQRWDGLAVMEGLVGELERHACPLLGGDTTGGEQLVVSLTVWGEAMPGEHGPGRLVTRSGAAPGDLLVVTGPLGGSLASGRHLRPEPRLAQGQWLAACPYVHAMMDLSDGLAADAPKLAEASGCGCLLLPGQVPVHPDVPSMSDQPRAACCDGEDFELLAAVAAEHWPALQLAWPFAPGLATVGWLLDRPGAFREDQHGRVVQLDWRGFEHQ